MGGGSTTNIVFNSHSQTNFTFPFNLSYNSTRDPTGAVITDLANKCGAAGGTKSNLNISYKITVSVSDAVSRTWESSILLVYLVGYPHPYGHRIACYIESIQFPLSNLSFRYQRTFPSFSAVRDHNIFHKQKLLGGKT